jgi:dTDP-glucose 4,6-dehydratase
VNPIGPRGVYDEAKRFAEAMTMAYHRYHDVDTKIVRIFNTYGPRMRLHDGRVVPAFIGEALTGKPLTIFGDGSQTRSFCYVSDLIDGIFRLAMSDFHEPVNIGNPREMTIKQFADEIIRITGTKSEIEYRSLPEDDPKVRQPDITRAKRILGWEPQVGFDEGIRETIAYFREHIELVNGTTKRNEGFYFVGSLRLAWRRQWRNREGRWIFNCRKLRPTSFPRRNSPTPARNNTRLINVNDGWK